MPHRWKETKDCFLPVYGEGRKVVTITVWQYVESGDVERSE